MNLKTVKKCQYTENCPSELSVTENGIMLREHRIVIPVTMRRKVVQIVHEGHQGLVKTKSLLRSKVWFPYMDKLTENIVKNCATCAVVTKDERTRNSLENKPDGQDCICDLLIIYLMTIYKHHI